MSDSCVIVRRRMRRVEVSTGLVCRLAKGGAGADTEAVDAEAAGATLDDEEEEEVPDTAEGALTGGAVVVE